jgi:hypothetical protein
MLWRGRSLLLQREILPDVTELERQTTIWRDVLVVSENIETGVCPLRA